MRRCPTKLLVPHKRAINFFAKFERYILDYHRTKLNSISLFATRISELLYEIFLQGGARCGILVTFTRTGKVIDKSTMFRAEKRAAQLSFFPYLRAQKIVQAENSCNGWKEWRIVIRYGRTSLG